MLNKKSNDERARLASDIAGKYALTDLKKQFANIRKLNEDYIAHVLFIGSYSAGKSALLNKFIGRSVLVENQGPQTNVATELRYSKNENIIANMLDGSKEEIQSTDDVDVKKVRNVEYYLDSENIKEQADYIIVDTPGFDSGIEAHNKALMQYIDEGTAFILVIDCERGTVSQSTLNFMSEITDYSENVAVVINKCDKRIDSEIEEVKNHISKVLQMTCGREFNIICTSIHDPQVVDKLKGLINAFSPEYLYEKNITAQLNGLILNLRDSLATIKEKKNLDTSDLDKEIEKREWARKKLLDKIEVQKKKLSNKLHLEVKEEILAKVKASLDSEVSVLAEAYQGGISLFQQRVIEIIRPVLISELEGYSAETCESFVKQINIDSLDLEDDSDQMKDLMNNIYSRIQNIKDLPLQFPNDEDMNSTDAGKNFRNIYRTITSILAIVSNTISPVLEIVIMFLPDILNLLNALSGNTKEKQLADAIQYKVIPKIINQLRKNLDSSLDEVEKALTDNITNNIEELINVENEALEAVKTKKNEGIDSYNAYIKEINEDIRRLEKETSNE